jgi:hypothetical protein
MEKDKKEELQLEVRRIKQVRIRTGAKAGSWAAQKAK